MSMMEERINSFEHNKILRVVDELNVAQKLNMPWVEKKTIGEKKKMLVTSIFSFSQNVFKSLQLEGCLKSELCNKGKGFV